MPYLTLSKRFECSVARRYFNPKWTLEQNSRVFGAESTAELGEGRNYIVYFAFEGPVDPATGMIRELSLIKERLRETLLTRYDHHYLNADTVPFSQSEIQPTPENVAIWMLAQARELFDHDAVKPVVCHLTDAPGSEATAYVSGRVERHRWFGPFPLLLAKDKIGFFQVRVTMDGAPDPETGMIVPEAMVWPEIEMGLRGNFETDFPMRGSQETVLRLWSFLQKRWSPVRLKFTLSDSSVIEWDGDRFNMGIREVFSATHRLFDPAHSVYENQLKFGKCHRYHGHQFMVEPTVETVQISEDILRDFREYVLTRLSSVQGRILDQTILKGTPATCEAFNLYLWTLFGDHTHLKLRRLRLWETTNNRFTLRTL